jgi:hypothetical protein
MKKLLTLALMLVTMLTAQAQNDPYKAEMKDFWHRREPSTTNTDRSISNSRNSPQPRGRPAWNSWKRNWKHWNGNRWS